MNFVEKCKAKKQRKMPLLIHTSKGLLLCLGFVDECMCKSIFEGDAFDSAVLDFDALHYRHDEVSRYPTLDCLPTHSSLNVSLPFGVISV